MKCPACDSLEVTKTTQVISVKRVSFTEEAHKCAQCGTNDKRIVNMKKDVSYTVTHHTHDLSFSIHYSDGRTVDYERIEIDGKFVHKVTRERNVQ